MTTPPLSIRARSIGLGIRAIRRLDQRHTRLREESEAYDQKWQIESASVVPIDDLAITAGDRRDGFIYVPTGPRLFAGFLRALPQDLGRYTFIDLGSGKGRTLILASEAGFGSAIGVEFARELHDGAVANIASYAAQGGAAERIECRSGDAGDFDFPEGPLVVYLHNPFNEQVMARVLGNLARSLQAQPREVWVCYLELSHEDPGDATENARLIGDSGLFESRRVPGGSTRDRLLLSPFNMHVFATPAVRAAGVRPLDLGVPAV